MKTRIIIGFTSLLAAGTIGFTAFGQNGPRGTGPQSQYCIQNQLGNTPVVEGDASAAEIDTMLFMKEEEKLARDVYAALAEKWGGTVFTHISQSEQRHMDAIDRLLSAYGIADTTPAEVGAFTVPEFGPLYTELVAKGSESQAAAIEVGIGIETMDIEDLTDAIANTSATVQSRIYANLLRGSGQHLKAFNYAKTSGTLDCDFKCMQVGSGRGNRQKMGRNMGPGANACPAQQSGLGQRIGGGFGKGQGMNGNCPIGNISTPARAGTGPNQ